MEGRKVVLVTGSGRSGTTVAMYLLEALGGVMSPEMTEAGPQNPDGDREDVQVSSLHRALLRQLHAQSLAIPLPAGWQQSPAARKAMTELQEIVAARGRPEGPNPWVLKDPQLAVLLPMWNRLLNVAKLVPAYVLCVRHPEAVVRSMEAQYARDSGVAATIWLLRNAYTLVDTGGNCQILHYEAWEDHGVEQLHKLVAHCGLAGEFRDAALEQLLARVYRKNLNRTGYVRSELRNRQALRLYDALAAVAPGELAGREAVAAAQEFLETLADVGGIISTAHEALRNVATLRERGAASPRADNAAAASAPLAQRVTAVEREVQQLRAELSRIVRNSEPDASAAN